jgi:hypothetical protein
VRWTSLATRPWERCAARANPAPVPRVMSSVSREEGIGGGGAASAAAGEIEDVERGEVCCCHLRLQFGDGLCAAVVKRRGRGLDGHAHMGAASRWGPAGMGA